MARASIVYQYASGDAVKFVVHADAEHPDVYDEACDPRAADVPRGRARTRRGRVVMTTVAERIMDEILTCLAIRASLKHIPGTHDKQAAEMAEAVALFDQWCDCRPVPECPTLTTQPPRAGHV